MLSLTIAQRWLKHKNKYSLYIKLVIFIFVKRCCLVETGVFSQIINWLDQGLMSE
jgi:hypothetical protein